MVSKEMVGDTRGDESGFPCYRRKVNVTSYGFMDGNGTFDRRLFSIK